MLRQPYLTEEHAVSDVLTVDEVRQHVAEVLGEPAADIGDHDDLLDRGLDSIRLMSLVERWRELGIQTSFIDLAETPTVVAWSQLFAGATR
jgi:bifunctional isochorismate lyase/aryl carrier protein